MKRDELLKIGDFAKICKLTVQTLRHYDKINLLKPSYIDSESGYRFYEKKQLFELTIIRQFRTIGWPIKEIKNLLKEKDFKNVLPLYQKRLKEIENQLEKLEYEKERISQFLQMTDTFENRLNHIELKKIEDRDFFYLKKERTGYLLDVLKHFADWQNLMEEAKVKTKPPFVFIYFDEYDKGIDQNCEIGLGHRLFDGQDYSEEHFYPCPEGLFLCSVVQGDYVKSREAYRKMKKWMDDNHYEAIGFTLVLFLLPIAVAKNHSDIVREIQIPVRKKNNY